MRPEHDGSAKRLAKERDLEADGENGAIGNLDDAYMIASLVLAEGINPDVAASLIATLSQDLGHPEALSRFVGFDAVGIADSVAERRHELIVAACRRLLGFKERATQCLD
ncbi:hypothetical protein [Lysobacter humi (ex Lee et al. 2017)]